VTSKTPEILFKMEKVELRHDWVRNINL